MEEVQVGTIRIGRGNPLVLIAGPCVLEDEAVVLETAGELKRLCADLKIPFIFKASYDKANRTSIKSYRGPGAKEGLAILKRIKENKKAYEWEVVYLINGFQVVIILIGFLAFL